MAVLYRRRVGRSQFPKLYSSSTGFEGSKFCVLVFIYRFVRNVDAATVRTINACLTLERTSDFGRLLSNVRLRYDRSGLINGLVRRSLVFEEAYNDVLLRVLINVALGLLSSSTNGRLRVALKEDGISREATVGR